MNPELVKLLRACKDSPEDAPRLVLSDWLEEHGDPDRAELIRSQLAYPDHENSDYPELYPEVEFVLERIRVAKLLRANCERWLGHAAERYRGSKLRRGFLWIRATPRQLLDHPPSELPADVFPWVEGLSLFVERDGLDEVLSSPILGCFSCLQLEGWFEGTGVDTLGINRVRRLTANRCLEGLRSLNLDKVDLTTAGVEALARCEQLAGLRELRLDGNQFGDGSVRALLEAPWLSSLTRLDLNLDCISVKTLRELSCSPKLSGLRGLSLGRLGLGERGARALARSPHLVGLTALDLLRCRIPAYAFEVLASSPYLRPLDLALELCDASCGRECGRMLAGAPLLDRVRSLNLVALGLTRLGVRDFLASPRLAGLERFRLWAPVGDLGCEVLAGADHFSRLRVAALGREDNIGPRGAAALARSPHLGRLAALSLDGRFTPEGVRALGDAPGLPRLEALTLGDSRPAKMAALEALAASGLMARLRRLRLYDYLNGDGAAALARLREAPRLIELDLSSNEIDADGAAALARCKGLRHLQCLDLGHNDIGDEGVEALVRSPYLTGLVELCVDCNGLGPVAGVALRDWPQRARMLSLSAEDHFLPQELLDEEPSTAG